MAAITLESDSSHSPPVLDQSNERSPKKSPKKRRICWSAAILCENSRRAWRIIPRSFGRRSRQSSYKRKFNVVKIKNTNE